MVAPGGGDRRAGRHHLRRGGAKRQDPLSGPVLLPLGHGPFPPAAVCPLRQDHRVGPAESPVQRASPVGGVGLYLGGEGLPELDEGPAGGPGEHLLPLRRQGRGERRPHPGGHPGGGPAGRGGPDAPVLCGAGLRPVLGDGGQVLVLLQPRGAGPLVLQGVDLQGGGAKGPPPAVLHGGQPHPVGGDPPAVRAGLSGGLLPAVRPGGVDGGRGVGL